MVSLFATLLVAQAIESGKLIEKVVCQQDPKYSYALYVPSSYKPGTPAVLLIGFDPGARGRNAVETFIPAAERYGWIVAGSNNSRNGDGEASAQSLRTTSEDIFKRFPVLSKRIYATGMSGGARIATHYAQLTGSFAGVIVAGATFLDGKIPRSVNFPIFGTAGFEDYNWSELYEMEQTLKSPHRVRNFDGGHSWMPQELATEAVEWFELQAMRSGLKEKDPQLIARLLADRTAKAEALEGRQKWEALRNIGQDFEGLHEEAVAFATRAKAMSKEKAVQAELKRDRAAFSKEGELTQEILRKELALQDPPSRPAALVELRERLRELVKDSKGTNLDALIARRVTRSVVSRFNATPKKDPEYRKVLDDLGLLRSRPNRQY